jgi:hypothetical protein
MKMRFKQYENRKVLEIKAYFYTCEFVCRLTNILIVRKLILWFFQLDKYSYTNECSDRITDKSQVSFTNIHYIVRKNQMPASYCFSPNRKNDSNVKKSMHESS